MTTISSRMLVAAVTTATLAMGATTAKADHYRRSCGVSYARYAPAYYPAPVYARAPVYAAPAYGYGNGYGCSPYRPVAYAQPVYYSAPAYYAPAPVYRSYYAPPRWGFGFGYRHGGHHGHRGHHGGGFSFSIGG